MPTNTSGGTTTSFFNTPQATDNCYTADEDCVYYFDVMSDDLRGSAKILWSIDDNNLYGTTTTSADGTITTTTNVDTVIDLTVKDATGCVEKSALGASISIVDGKVKYDARALDWLADGQTATDYFTYAIRLANGTLSWATVAITLTGSNDAPTIVSATAVGDVTEKAEPTEGGTLSDTGTITFADVDLTDTHSATVSASVVDENGITVASPLGALTLGAVDQAANNVGWTYSVNDTALDFLAAGETRIQVYTITINDGHTGGNATQTVTLTITGTNDAPVLTVDQVGGVTEDAANPTLTDSGVLSFTDVDVTDTHIVSKSYNSDAIWSGGSLTAGEIATLIAGFTVDSNSWDYSLANAAVQFLGAGETITLSFDVTVTDDSGAVNNSDTQTVTLTITGTNDAPVLTGDLAAPINEGGTYQLTTADLNYTDPDDGAANVTFTVSGLTNGTLYVNGVTGNVFTGAQLAAGLVTFQHNGSETVTAGFQVSVEDGNEDLSTPVAQAFNFTVTPVNDAPVNRVPGAQSVNEDNALVFSTANGNAISISDADAGVGTVRVTLSVANGMLTLGSLSGLTFTAGTNGSASFTIEGTQAAINTALQGLIYQGNLNYFGPDSISIVTSDLGNSGSGGALTDSDSVTITVSAVNDAPVNTVPGGQSINAGTSLVFSSGTSNAISISDVDAGSNTVQATLSVTNGTLTLGSTTGLTITSGANGSSSVTVQGTQAAINAALQGLAYLANLSFSGSDSLSIITSDLGNSGAGGSLTDTDSIAITVNAVRAAPTDIRLTMTSPLLDPNNLNISIQGTLTATDPDPGAFTFTFSGGGTTLANSGTNFQISGSTFSSTSNLGQNSTYILPIVVTQAGDGILSWTETFRIITGSNQGTDTLTGNATGDDILYGGGGAETIMGLGGDDTIFGHQEGDLLLSGGAGRDTIYGGDGNDTLNGGADADIFVFNIAANNSSNHDTIQDFEANGVDLIHLDNAVFTQLTATGTLSSANFASNAGGTATDGNDYILFDTSTGNLYYDPDGNGGTARLLIATLTVTAGTIDPTDILII